MIVLRPYNTAGSVTLTLRQAGSDAFATSANWTPAAGDVKLSLDGGTQANATNLPTFANGQWTLSLTAAELQAARTRINIDDVDIIPESILIETYGHASAAYPTAYADQWLGIASKITTDHGAGSYVDTGGALTPEQATWIEETHEKAMLIGTGGAFVEVPIDGDSNITVRRSRDYQQADGLAIEWSNPDGTWPDLTGATIVARVARPGCKTSALYDFAASVVAPTGSQIVRLELTKAQLAIIADDYTYELVATLSGGSVVTLVDGQFRVVLGRDAP